MTGGALSRKPLKSGGELAIYESGCKIEYFFGGPDERYGGVHLAVQESLIPAYIRAWQNNFERLEELRRRRDKRPVTETGECRMLIRAGFMEGVYIRGSHMRISTRSELEQVVADYEYAAACGKGC